MKWTFIVILIFIHSNFCFSQDIKIGIVDVDSIVNSILEKSKFDSIYEICKENYFKLGENWVKKFNDKANEWRKYGGDYNLEKNKEIQRKFETMQNDIVMFEKFLLDTLPMYKEQLIKEMDSIVVSEYEKLGKEKGYSLILRKSQLIYFDDKENIADFKINNKIEYQKNIENLIRKYQIIFLEKYNQYFLILNRDYS